MSLLRFLAVLLVFFAVRAAADPPKPPPPKPLLKAASVKTPAPAPLAPAPAPAKVSEKLPDKVPREVTLEIKLMKTRIQLSEAEYWQVIRFYERVYRFDVLEGDNIDLETGVISRHTPPKTPPVKMPPPVKAAPSPPQVKK